MGVGRRDRLEVAEASDVYVRTGCDVRRSVQETTAGIRIDFDHVNTCERRCGNARGEASRRDPCGR